jgi:hypothetical protein
MRFCRTTIFLIICLCIINFPVIAQNSLKEPSTEKSFPSEIKFTYNAKEYSLQCTGLAVRKKFFFKVYGMAHYIEGINTVNNKNEAYSTIIAEGKAKEIMMVFVRNVDVKSIRDTYNEGFKNNTSDAELKEIQPLIEIFLGYFSKDVKENDRFVFRWIPDGTIVVIINDEEKPAITNKLFARTLWSIWFGEDSVVDREDLVGRMISKK